MATQTVSLRITLRYKDLDEFARRYAENVSSAGLFLRTRTPKPPGTKIKFELLLSNGEAALKGDGVVVSVRQDDKPGMAIRFNVLEGDSWATVERVVQEFGEGALAPTPLGAPFRGGPVGGARPKTGRVRTGLLGFGAAAGPGAGAGAWGARRPSEDRPAATPSPEPAAEKDEGSDRPHRRTMIDRPWALRRDSFTDPSELRTQRISTAALREARQRPAPAAAPAPRLPSTREVLARAHRMAERRAESDVHAAPPGAPGSAGAAEQGEGPTADLREAEAELATADLREASPEVVARGAEPSQAEAEAAAPIEDAPPVEDLASPDTATSSEVEADVRADAPEVEALAPSQAEPADGEAHEASDLEAAPIEAASFEASAMAAPDVVADDVASLPDAEARDPGEAGASEVEAHEAIDLDAALAEPAPEDSMALEAAADAGDATDEALGAGPVDDVPAWTGSTPGEGAIAESAALASPGEGAVAAPAPSPDPGQGAEPAASTPEPRPRGVSAVELPSFDAFGGGAWTEASEPGSEGPEPPDAEAAQADLRTASEEADSSASLPLEPAVEADVEAAHADAAQADLQAASAESGSDESPSLELAAEAADADGEAAQAELQATSEESDEAASLSLEPAVEADAEAVHAVAAAAQAELQAASEESAEAASPSLEPVVEPDAEAAHAAGEAEQVDLPSASAESSADESWSLEPAVEADAEAVHADAAAAQGDLPSAPEEADEAASLSLGPAVEADAGSALADGEAAPGDLPSAPEEAAEAASLSLEPAVESDAAAARAAAAQADQPSASAESGSDESPSLEPAVELDAEAAHADAAAAQADLPIASAESSADESWSLEPAVESDAEAVHAHAAAAQADLQAASEESHDDASPSPEPAVESDAEAMHADAAAAQADLQAASEEAAEAASPSLEPAVESDAAAAHAVAAQPDQPSASAESGSDESPSLEPAVESDAEAAHADAAAAQADQPIASAEAAESLSLEPAVESDAEAVHAHAAAAQADLQAASEESHDDASPSLEPAVESDAEAVHADAAAAAQGDLPNASEESDADASPSLEPAVESDAEAAHADAAAAAQGDQPSASVESHSDESPSLELAAEADTEAAHADAAQAELQAASEESAEAASPSLGPAVEADASPDADEAPVSPPPDALVAPADEPSSAQLAAGVEERAEPETRAAEVEAAVASGEAPDDAPTATESAPVTASASLDDGLAADLAAGPIPSVAFEADALEAAQEPVPIGDGLELGPSDLRTEVATGPRSGGPDPADDVEEATRRLELGRAPEVREVSTGVALAAAVESAEVAERARTAPPRRGTADLPEVGAVARGRDVSVTGLSLDPTETEVYPPPTPSARPSPGSGPRRPAVEQTAASAPELQAQPLAVDPTESGAPLIGVDLGGRWVRCALVHEGQVRGLPIDGNPYVPALVAVAPDGRTVVCGMQAMERSLEDPASAASIVELLRAMDDSSIAHPALRGAVGRAPDGRPVATVGGTTFATGDLLYAFFRRMEPSLTALLGQAPRVVMSVPHELSDAARELVADAARHAGLAVEVLVPEPLAILRAYRAAVQGMETVMTVDLGATHLGIAVARRGRDDFFVIESRWNAEVSAESIDAAVAELGMAELGWREHEVPLATRMELLRGAEQARTDLRRDPHVELPVTLADGPGEPARVHVLSIPRSRVYQATQTVTDQVIVAARAALATAGVHPKALGAVILSGSGGVYPPLVGALTTMTGREPLQTVPAAEAVLVGLAELAADRSQTGRAAKPDALTAAIGIGLPGGRFRALVPAGTKLPTQLTRRQPTVRDAQTEVELTLYQGNADVVNECEHLGTIAIRDLPRAARGQIAVDVEVFVDADAVMAITLSEAYTGKRVQLTVATQQTASQRRAQLAQRPSLTDLSDPSRARGKKGFFNRLFGR